MVTGQVPILILGPANGGRIPDGVLVMVTRLVRTSIRGPVNSVRTGI